MKNYYVYKATDGQIVLVDDVNVFVKKVYDPDLHEYSGVMLSVTEGKNFKETIERACKLYENPASEDGEVFVADEPELIKQARENFEQETNNTLQESYDFLERARQALKAVAIKEGEKLNKDPRLMFELIRSAYIIQLEKMKYDDEV